LPGRKPDTGQSGNKAMAVVAVDRSPVKPIAGCPADRPRIEWSEPEPDRSRFRTQWSRCIRCRSPGETFRQQVASADVARPPPQSMALALHMKTRLYTLAILIAVTGCTHLLRTTGGSDRQFVGKWRSFEGPGPIKASSDLMVLADGRFEMFVQVVADETFRKDICGTWRARNGELVLRVTGSNSDEIVPMEMSARIKKGKLLLRDPLDASKHIVYQKSIR